MTLESKTGRIFSSCRRLHNSRKQKEPSLRISREAMRIALEEIRREGKRIAFPLQRFVFYETSHISRDDRFAALQIDFSLTVRYSRLSLSHYSIFLSLLVLRFYEIDLDGRWFCGTRPIIQNREHLVVFNAVFVIDTARPRFEPVVVVKFQ